MAGPRRRAERGPHETTLTTIDTYLAAWNETDPQRRAELVEEAWNPEGTYLDPMLEATGRQAIDEMAAGIQAAYPGHTFRRTTQIDGHHDVVRFGWQLVAPDGSVTVAGIDVAELDGDGRLRAVAGFFGELTEK
jgi:hypothetical protein